MKHHGRSPDPTVTFFSAESELLIYDACNAYSDLEGELPLLLRAYQSWYAANNVDIFALSDGELPAFLKWSKHVVKLGRKKFFKAALSGSIHRVAK